MNTNKCDKNEKINDINNNEGKGNKFVIVAPNINIETEDNDSKNVTVEKQSPIGISKNLLRITMESKMKCYGLSPISEIVLNLSDTSIEGTTPIKKFGFKELLNKNEKVISQPSNEEEDFKSTDSCAKNNTTINKNTKDDGKSEDENLISNNFTLNSASSNNVNSNNRNVSAARRLAARGAQRRLNIEPQILDDSDTNNSSTMSTDDLSFYDDITISGTTIDENLFDNNNVRSSITSNELDDDDDENSKQCSNNDELLSYECSPQRFIVRKNTITLIDKNRLLDEIDGSNSIDSGYGTFKFTEPKLLKKQQLLFEPSPPRKYTNDTATSPKQFHIFHSLSSGSMESMDDDYMTDLIEMESLEDNDNEKFPTNLNSLISGHIKTIKTTPDIKRSAVRRCLSLTENCNIISPKTPEFLKPIKDLSLNITPFSSKQLDQQQRIVCFKRPEPPSFSPIQSKRYKTESSMMITSEKENLHENNNKQRQRPILRKSMSLNDAQIMTALARSTSEPDLIGDFSKSFCLPLMEGRHRDLKSISCETVAKIIRGEFNDSIESYKIIDCRYPYEYEGGHIHGAQNFYTQEQILNELVKCKTETPTVQPDGPKRNILIFHCEFSSERGPKLSRFLRNYDRVQNSNAYPALYYPEIYLLHNGYKEFYENYSDLCDPVAYRPMLEPSFGDLYRQFRAKSKSWNGDIKTSGSKIGLKKSRSRLVL